MGRTETVLSCVTSLFRTAIRTAYPTLAKAPVSVVIAKKDADYQCNSAMGMSKVREGEKD